MINILSFSCAFLDVLESAAGTHINQLCSRNELPVNCGCTDSQGVLTCKTGPTHTHRPTMAFGTANAVSLLATEYCICKKYRFLATNVKVDKSFDLEHHGNVNLSTKYVGPESGQSPQHVEQHKNPQLEMAGK